MLRRSIARLPKRFTSFLSIQRRCLSQVPTGMSEDEEKRKYFYVIDDKGQLFMEDCKHRNFVSCFKEKTFLQRFYSWMRHNDSGHYMEEFPWISPCGSKEVNYVRIEDGIASVAFGEISSKTTTFSDPSSAIGIKLEEEGDLFLSIGSSIVKEPFDPQALLIDESTGRFYHPITGHKYLKGTLGLLHPRISHLLSDRITAEEQPTSDDTLIENKVQYFIRWNDTKHSIVSTTDYSMKIKSAQ